MDIRLPDPNTEIPVAGLEAFRDEFIADRWTEIIALKTNVLENDYQALKKVAHNWVGFCDPYGFQGLGYLARLLEKSAISKNYKDCVELMTHIETYLINKKKTL